MAVVADAGAEGSLNQAPHYPSMRKKSTIFSYLASISLGRNISVVLLLLVLAFLSLYPLSMLFYGSLHSTPPGMAGEFNLDGYRQIMTNENFVILLYRIGICLY
jgi:hypothetical protein